MNNNIAYFKEELSSKIPALTLLSTLGYQFISPSQCEKSYGNSNALLQQLLTGKRTVKVEPTDLEIRVS
ncbi:MAG: hypothetical protein V5788_01910 [Shewanella sp.]